MIQSLKTIKNRIRSIDNTKKVTAAMEMISVSKLNRIEKTLFVLRPYILSLERVMLNLVNSQEHIAHPYFDAKVGCDKLCLCVITSDGGLCGSYNNNIIRVAEEFIRGRGKDKVSLVCVGRKGFNYFRKSNLNIANSYIGLNGRFSEKASAGIIDNLVDIFVSGKAAEVYVAYTHFKTALINEPKVEKILNISPAPHETKTEYIFEPDVTAILNEIAPKYISMKFKLIMMEAFTAEHSARTVAMKTATDNARDLLQGLVLLRNKVRQANITQEMLEIISSSEALKG